MKEKLLVKHYRQDAKAISEAELTEEPRECRTMTWKFSPHVIPKSDSNLDKKLKKVDKAVKGWYKANETTITKLVKDIKIFWLSCLVWFIVGSFVPSLREALPHLYMVVDGTIAVMDKIFELLISFFKGLLLP